MFQSFKLRLEWHVAYHGAGLFYARLTHGPKGSIEVGRVQASWREDNVGYGVGLLQLGSSRKCITDSRAYAVSKNNNSQHILQKVSEPE